MTTAAEDHYERLLAAHYTWMLGGDLPAHAAGQRELLRELGVRPGGTAGSVAVDLGCGSGAQTLALADLGFDPVVAVDTSAELLDELARHASGRPGVRPVRADLRTALPKAADPGTVAAVVCMGDTLTHLATKDDVTALLADVARALAPGGRFVVTWRDLTRLPSGSARFIPVRSAPDRLLTCFLEERDADTVTVHDLLYIRRADEWTLETGAYPKLRIGPDWLAARCADAGLTVLRNAETARGVRLLLAEGR
ncbi:class I SAM-dependent methyltransferase [Allostreptomyces psammosilenae]|uniref:SAM-dependent methyltransferase n=1 Tax=Allostreptomyces psammosilenae TaxID=1892865 RepID=A0A852ZXZ0_9ACTN|nr:class I SAM-dependent methyltransferase [Allostreptomyces psammosilenae]NYI07243.1 SAM-dependent methyltransferase [Allostreptomyces psammosilenae]